jgi:medium-chain acyl-[acyl-carrier-protein] hydrolase
MFYDLRPSATQANRETGGTKLMNSKTLTPWLTNSKLNARAKLRLFCFPYAGGSSLIFRNWQGNLPPAVEVCPVQLPGRGNRLREPVFTQAQPLVRALAEGLLPHVDVPFAFFGHSMGAMLSFELARHLRREHNVEPRHLFVSGRRAPQVPSFEAPTYDLPTAEFIEALRHLNGTPPEVLSQSELMQKMIPLLRGDFEVCDTYSYTPEPPLSCPITVFGGLQDTGVKREHLDAWREQTGAAFFLRMLPGDHFFLNKEQAVLLRLLAKELYPVIM